MASAPIGVFDSGYGGLTVLRSLVDRLPQYDYLYLGDNARSPYGNRGFDTVYRYTLQCVEWLHGQGCPLIVLACNTASAKALRSIQQKDLDRIDPKLRVLGVIRPTSEIIGSYSSNGHIGILATKGTVDSASYLLEIEKFFPELKVSQNACPMWVPLIENNEHNTPGASYFVQKYLEEIHAQDPEIDTMLLACTHYPLLESSIHAHLPAHVKLVGQGAIVADRLEDYLNRHPEIRDRITVTHNRSFYTTDSTTDFDAKASIFFGEAVKSLHVNLV